MKITVGELVKKDMLDKGIDPKTIERAFEPLGPTLEAMSSVTKRMEEPMRAAAKAAEAIQPQIDAIQKMKLPDMSNLMLGSVIPDRLRDEDGGLFIPQVTRPVQQVEIVNPEVLRTETSQEEVAQNAVSYPLPPKAVWESLTVKFVDGHIVKVSYVGMESKKFDFKDMGFINMKTMKPDKKWELLRAIADNGGALTVSGWNRQFGRNVKYELNEGLKRFFHMNENPIPHYNKRQGYRTLFTLKSDQ